MLTLLFLVVIVIALCFSVFVRRSSSREAWPNDIAFDNHRVQAMSLLLGVIMSLLLCAFLSFHRAMAVVSTPVLEVVLILVFHLLMDICVLSQPAHVCKIRGYTLRQAMGEDAYDSDSGTLLMIIGMVTGVHVCLPLRWGIVLFLELAGIFLYGAIVVAIGSEERTPAVLFNLIFLTAIMIATVVGKRAAELDERVSFWKLIEEKTLRCRAEYQLAQVGPRPEAAADLAAGVGSDHGSLPVPGSMAATSTASAKVFEAMFGQEVDPAHQLGCMAQLGDSEHWRIKEEEVKILQEDALGIGGFGVVRRAVFCGILVAVKSPKNELDSASLRRVPELCNELRVLRHLRHPNIVATHGAIVLPQRQQIALVLEHIEGVVLQQFLRHGGPHKGGSQPSVLARYQLMIGVCRALLYMHTRCPAIIHGDLKSSNIMVELCRRDAHPKLLDFGLSRVLSRHPRPLGGSIAWMAPELLGACTPVRCSADIYSFGRVLAFVATSTPPMPNLSAGQIVSALGKKRPPLPSWPEGNAFKPCCMLLTQACLGVPETVRPSIREIHERLLCIPDELGLTTSHAQDSFIKSVRAIAAQPGSRLPAPPADRPRGPEEPNQQEPRVASRLASLPEEEPVTAEAAHAPRPASATRPSGRSPPQGATLAAVPEPVVSDSPTRVTL